MKEITFKGVRYPVHTDLELTGANWKSMAELLERGLTAPEQIPNILRECMAICVPLAASAMRQWTVNDILLFSMSTIPLIRPDGPTPFQRFSAALPDISMLIKIHFIDGKVPPSGMN